MIHNGWSHLVVQFAADRGYRVAVDNSSFDSEQQMLDELGATGWELVHVREDDNGVLHYYFKRPRA